MGHGKILVVSTERADGVHEKRARRNQVMQRYASSFFAEMVSTNFGISDRSVAWISVSPVGWAQI
jgi:hypothetical protein